MLPLELSVSLEEDEGVRKRIVMAFNVVAHDVLNEGPSEHELLRKNHANRVLQVPSSGIEYFVGGVIGSNAIQFSGANAISDITDTMIVEGIKEVWNSLIGINVGAQQ